MERQSAEPLLHSELTDKIIAAFYAVYNELGYGFLEKVYENAMVEELRARSITFRQQVPVKVYYRNVMVGDYFADLLVDDKVIVGFFWL